MIERLNVNKSKEFIIGEFPIQIDIDESVEIGDIDLKKYDNVKIIVNDNDGPYPHCHIVQKLSHQKPVTICCIRLDANAYFQHGEKGKLNDKPLKNAEEKLFYKVMSSSIDKSNKSLIDRIQSADIDINKIHTHYDLAREAWNRNTDPKSDKNFLPKIPIPKYNVYMKSHEEQKREEMTKK